MAKSIRLVAALGVGIFLWSSDSCASLAHDRFSPVSRFEGFHPAGPDQPGRTPPGTWIALDKDAAEPLAHDRFSPRSPDGGFRPGGPDLPGKTPPGTLLTQGREAPGREQEPRNLLEGLKDGWDLFLKDMEQATAPFREEFARGLVGPFGQLLKEHGQLLQANFEGLFNRSQFQGGRTGPLEGGRVSGVISPSIRFNEQSALAAVYNGSYNRELQVFTEDEGPRQRTEQQRHEFILLHSLDFTKPFGIPFLDRLTVSPSVFQNYAFTRESAEEEWGNGVPFRGVDNFKGLYDYWERGGGLEARFSHEPEKAANHSLSLTAQAYLRHYRNFISLARQLDPSSPQPRFEKDYFGVLARGVYQFLGPEGLSVRLGLTHQNKLFTEDRADEDPLQFPGVAGGRRRDLTNTLDWRVSSPIGLLEGLTLGLSGNFEYTKSNSGFNDTLSPIPPVGVFSEKYYDYWSLLLSPEVSFRRKVNTRLFGFGLSGTLILSASYSWSHRRYEDRKAKDEFGNLKDLTEIGVTHVISPRLVYQFHKNWALVLEAKRTIARANTEDERTFRYNYDINSFGMGLQYNF